MLVAYGAYTGMGMLASTAGGVAIAELSGVAATNATLAWLGGGALSVGGFGMVGGMAVFGWLVAGPALAILGAMSTDEMKEKLEKAKAYYSQVEKAVKKADAIIDQFQAIEKMAKLFTRQIAKFDALLFSLSQDAIATMKKTQLRYLSLQSKRKRSTQRYGFNSHDFERFFESPHHRQRPKAPREGAKGFGDHERADG
ncbi:hypothetical protein VN1286_08460 [Helicobacter pylori]|nr:hypothetical protein VN1250_06350 [Helicobacter pylori]GHS14420.1 hypothetical protein VN1286_08460 [Helicobacter pylori]